MTISEHVTALFVGGLYYWLSNDDACADMCWRTAVTVHKYNRFSFVGEA